MSERGERMAYGSFASKTYAACAALAGYEGFYRSLFRQPGKRILDGARVLDAGCGHCPLSFALDDVLRERGELASIHAFDRSPQMLGLAERRAKEKGIALYGADALDLRAARAYPDGGPHPFGDGEFDLVMSAGMLEYVPDTERAARELLRVLRPGGTLLLVTIKDDPVGKAASKAWGFRLLETGRLADAFGMRLEEIVVPSRNLYLRSLKRALVGRK